MKANTITNGIIRIILYFLWRTFSPIRIEMGIIKFIGKVYQFISTCEPSKSGSQSRLTYIQRMLEYRNKVFEKTIIRLTANKYPLKIYYDKCLMQAKARNNKQCICNN